jgi:hypothetical protein
MFKNLFQRKNKCKEEKLALVRKFRNIVNNNMRLEPEIMEIYTSKTKYTTEDVEKLIESYTSQRHKIYESITKIENKIRRDK